jgi:hypothetical protein
MDSLCGQNTQKLKDNTVKRNTFHTWIPVDLPVVEAYLLLNSHVIISVERHILKCLFFYDTLQSRNMRLFGMKSYNCGWRGPMYY